MSAITRDGSASTLYMKFDKILRSAQGMAIWQDRAFILYDTGMCGVYDLKGRTAAPLAAFPLGSYNEGMPTRDYLNHANHCMFGSLHWGDNPIPLLYVTVGTGIGADADGYYYRLSVENIVESAAGYRAEVLQTVTYQPSESVPAPWEAPCWGCPAFFVNNAENALYIFSARYRTKRGCVPEGEHNAYIITRFDLPSLDAGPLVRLTARDIRDQFSVASDIPFTQGGQLTDGILYYTFGCPKAGYPVHVMAFDLRKKSLLWQAGNMDEAFRGEEIECCDWYKGQLLCNTNGGSLYALRFREEEQNG